ncbi:MAG: OprD family porin [Pseudomonas sp.]|jgi:imipenem/basic amino acid-specific outer membrane pore|uniref:OprD family porin n=1 Tax=Pseudomonas sp. TaxID=306 RepID=UPI0023844468|nr:OprD family porin [Pseudomonas sp.]MDE1195807.1 OprD family porin [Pseudomonas sp.]
MSSTRWSAVALAVSAAVSQMAWAESVTDQSEAKGFIEDSSLNVLARNYYFNRNRTNGAQDNRDWTQGFQANYSSGFTQGTVGFGVDAYGYWGVKLDGDSKYAGTGNLPLDNDGDPQDSYGSAGGSVKVRVSKTELHYGNMQPTSPVFAVGGSRLLPQTATGFNLNSSEIEGLDLEAGRYTSTNSGITSNHDHEIWATYAGVSADSVSFAGAKYAITPNWGASFYGSEFKDIWNQYYVNTNYTLPISDDQSLLFDFNLYRTLDEGQAKAGTINNTTYSASAAYSFLSAHTLTLSYQKVHGDTPFDYAGTGNNGGGEGGDSIFLANSVQWSDFNGPGEKSWGIRYDLNMATYGVPGLSFMARYLNGSDVDGTHTPSNSRYAGIYGEDGKHHETDVEAKYVVQTGPAKDLSFRIRQAFHNANQDQGEGDLSEFRLIVDYPISVL